MNEIKVSVLVPVYGVEQYIERCARSIFGQTYDNLEIIFVDDCTPDRSMEILRRVLNDYPSRKPQTRILRHDHNRGLAAARNTAVAAATGEFVMFVDSDDWAANDFCEAALGEIARNDVAIASFGLEFVYPDHHEIRAVSKSLKFGAEDAMVNLITDQLPIYNYACNKIFRRSLFSGLCFPVGRKWEDIGLMYLLVDRAGGIFASNKVLYYYIQHSGNISSGWDSPQSISDRMDTWLERLSFFQKHYPKAYDYEIKEISDQAIDVILHWFRNARLLKKCIAFLRQYKNDVQRVNKSKILRFGYWAHIF